MVEIADSSLAKDQDIKLPLYAEHGVPKVWIVNLVDTRLEIYRQPVSGDRRYARETLLPEGNVAPERFRDILIDVAALLARR